MQSLLLHPEGPAEAMPLPSGGEPFEHDGGKLIFSWDNGLQGCSLSTAQGIRLQVGPTTIVSYRNKPVGKGVETVDARSCFDCHENGIIRKTDKLRRFIETSTSLYRDQREILLEMSPAPEVIETFYRNDAATFRAALEELGVTQPDIQAYVPQTAGAYDDQALAALEYTTAQQATPNTPPAAGSLPV